jgi:hypothetical protein
MVLIVARKPQRRGPTNRIAREDDIDVRQVPMNRSGHLMLPRLFRHRRIAQIFPIGCAAAFILGVVAAPMVLGVSTVGRAIMYSVGIGLVGSIGLFAILRVLDRRM